MAEFEIRITGKDQADALLKRLGDGGRACESTIRVGSDQPYAWGIHFGQKRSGGLARRAGGTFFLTDPLERRKPDLKRAIAAALSQGGAAVQTARLRVAYQIEADAKSLVPAVTGNLRRSIHTVTR